MPNINAIFIIEVKNNKITKVERKDQQPMKRTNVGDPRLEYPNFQEDPPSNDKLKHGCVSLGMAYAPEGESRCIWRFGTWW